MAAAPPRFTIRAVAAGLTKVDPATKRAMIQLERAAQDLQTRTSAIETGYLFVGRRVFAANAQYTPTNGVKTVRVTMSGAGGGAGGANGGAGTGAASGGAGSGALVVFWVIGTKVLTGGAISIGTGGVTGGGTGGATTCIINGITYTAPGGLGSVGMGAGSTFSVVPGGVAGSNPTPAGAFDYVTGVPGQPGLRTVGFGTTIPGNGGATYVGITAQGNISAFSNGANGGGFGAGGAGANAGAASFNGGVGSGGVVIIEEYK